MCNFAAKVRQFSDIHNSWKLFCKKRVKCLCMCEFFSTFVRFNVNLCFV